MSARGITASDFRPDRLEDDLNAIYDLERLTTRITYQSANPRDLIAFKTSVSMLAPIRNLLDGSKSSLLKEIRDDIDPLDDLQKLIETTIIDDPPLQIREGGEKRKKKGIKGK